MSTDSTGSTDSTSSLMLAVALILMASLGAMTLMEGAPRLVALGTAAVALMFCVARLAHGRATK